MRIRMEMNDNGNANEDNMCDIDSIDYIIVI